jgi:hypothetical protein
VDGRTLLKRRRARACCSTQTTACSRCRVRDVGAWGLGQSDVRSRRSPRNTVPAKVAILYSGTQVGELGDGRMKPGAHQSNPLIRAKVEKVLSHA